MSLEGLQAQTLASLPGGTHKFCLCPHSWLSDTCLCTAPPSFPHCPSISWRTDQWSPPPRLTCLLPTLLPQSVALRAQASISQSPEASPSSFPLSVPCQLPGRGGPCPQASSKHPSAASPEGGDV